MKGETSWSRTTLGVALPIRYGKARTDKAGVVREDSPVYGSSGVIGKFNRALTNGPALIVGRKGTVGATHYSAEPCWPIDTVYFAEASEDKDLRFFKYLLDHLRLGSMDRSTAVPGLSRDDYNAKEVFVPSLDEQRRIVAEIEKHFTRLETGVATLQSIQAKLKRCRTAILKAACEGSLVPTEAELARQENRSYEPAEILLQRILRERREKWSGKRKYKDPAAPNTANLPKLPGGWTWATLEQLCPRFVDSAHRTPKYGSRGVPALGPRDVVNGKLDIVNARRVDETEFKIQTARHIPEPGDIVYSRELSLGWGVILPEGERVCLSQGMCLFRPHREIDVDYFVTMLNGPAGRAHAERAATGSAHPHINLGDIKRYVFPLPPPAEQTRIVEEVERRLSVVDELEAVVSDNLQRAKGLRQSILQSAFQASRLPIRQPDSRSTERKQVSSATNTTRI